MKFKNDIEAQAGFKDAEGDLGIAGQLLSSTGTETNWIDQSTIASGSAEVVDIKVKNISAANGGINLSKGDPVYIYGSVGASARLYVDLADADSTATNNLGDGKMPCVGLLDQDLSPNGEGTATVVGKLRNLITNPIDGDVPNENDTVYVKSGGGLTLTKPTGSTNLIQNVGQVGRVSTSSDGNIVVAALLRSNDVPNLPEGRIWIGDGNTIVSDTVYVDEPNNRVGIGTTNPSTKLHIEDTNPTLKILSNQVFGPSQISMGNGTSEAGLITCLDNPAINFLEIKYDNGGSGDGRIRVGQNNLDFLINSVTAMYINSSKNVGIGTTSPPSKLSVSGGTLSVSGIQSSTGVVKLGDPTDPNPYVGIYRSAAAAIATGGNFLNLGGYDGIAFTTGAAQLSGQNECMRILSNGNVGIGTTSPFSKLEVSGDTSNALLTLKSYNGGTNDAFMRFYDESNGPSYSVGLDSSQSLFAIAYGTDGNTLTTGQRFVINSAGNVGIGTTNPGAKTHIFNGTAQNGLIVENSSSSFTDSAIFANNTSTTNGNLLRLRSSASDRMIVSGQGNVGIGVTSPSRKLEVRASSEGSSGGIVLTDFTSGTSMVARLQDSATGGRLYLKTNTDSDGVVLNAGGDSYFNNGNVGIGITNPSHTLEVAGTVQIKNGITSYLYLQNVNNFLYGDTYGNTIIRSADNFRIQTGSYPIERVRVNSAGNVGIGTTTPDVKLEVESTASASGIRIKNTNSGFASLDIESNRSTGSNLGGLRYRKTGQANSQAEINYVSNVRFDFLSGSGTSAPTQKLSILNNGNVGIGTNSPSELLHLRSTGPARLLIEADSDNVTETDNAQIILKQDAGAVVGRLGYRTNTNDLELLNEYTSNIYLGTSNSIRATLHANGNFGIGNSTPQAKLHVSNGLLRTWSPTSGTSAIFESTVSSRNFVTLTAANEAELWFGDATTQTKGRIRYEMAGNNMEFWTNASQKMVINSSGNVGINTTNPGAKLEIVVPDYYSGCKLTGPASGTSFSYMGFYAGTSYRGVISPTSTGVNYNSASDYRLKENVIKLQNSTERIKKLKPSNFNFLENPSKTVDGFIAHEVQEVVPEAVTGEKDAVGRDGRPEYQGIDQSKIVPLLTAALQEAISKIEQLETRIQKLENK